MSQDVSTSLGTVLSERSEAFWNVASNNVGPPPNKNTLNLKQGLSRNPLQIETPLTGETVTIDANVAYCLIAPAGPLAALTINMLTPPTPGQFIQISISQNITALTHNGNGSTLLEPFLTTINNAVVTQTWFYRAVDTTWYPVSEFSGCAPGSGTLDQVAKFNAVGCQVVDSALTETASIVTIQTAAIGTDSSELRFEDDDGSAYVSWRAPAIVAVSTTYVMPDRSTGPIDGSAMVISGAPAGTTDLTWTDFPPIECANAPSAVTTDALVKFNGTDCEAVESTVTQTGAAVNLNPSGGAATELRLLEPTASGSNYFGFVAPALASNLMYIVPNADGAVGEHLTTDGALNLSWSKGTAELNDLFVCVRPGETVEIDVLHAENNQLNIDATTVAIVKTPLHAASALSVNGTTGVITYVADTRYVGQDQFMFEADEVGGSTLQRRATVHVDIQVGKPDPTVGNGAHFIFSDSVDNIPVRQYSGTSATTTDLFNIGAGDPMNGLATNRDDSLIYMTNGTKSSISAWSYVDDEIFTVVANMGTDPVFADAVALHPDGGDVSPFIGATYHDGIYYVGGGTDATDGYFRVVMAKYIPAAGVQTVLDAQYIVFSDGLTRVYGDLQYDHQSGNLLVLSDVNVAATASGTISVVEPSTGVVLSRVPLVAPFTLTALSSKQLTYGSNGELLVADEGATESILRRLNPQTGSGSDYGAPNDIENLRTISDMAEYIAPPCTPTNYTNYPGLFPP